MFEEEWFSEDLELVGNGSFNLHFWDQISFLTIVIDGRGLKEVASLHSPEVLVSVIKTGLYEVIQFNQNIQVLDAQVQDLAALEVLFVQDGSLEREGWKSR